MNVLSGIEDSQRKDLITEYKAYQRVITEYEIISYLTSRYDLASIPTFALRHLVREARDSILAHLDIL